MVRSSSWRRWHWQNSACLYPSISRQRKWLGFWWLFFFSAGIIWSLRQPQKSAKQNWWNGFAQVSSIFQLISNFHHPALMLTLISSNVITLFLTQWKEADPQKHSFQPHELWSSRRQCNAPYKEGFNCAIPCKCQSLSIFWKQLGRWQEQKMNWQTKILCQVTRIIWVTND